MLHKIQKCFIIFFVTMIILCGYTFPSDITPTIKLVSGGQQYTIYFPTGIDNKLYMSEELGTIINTSSSTINGITNVRGTDYTVYFPTYNTPYYRTGATSNQYVYLTDIDLISIENFDTYSKANKNVETTLLIAMVVLLFLNLFKGGF